MDPDDLQKLFEEAIAQTLEERNLSDSELEEAGERIAETIPGIADDVSSLIYGSLRSSTKSMLKDTRRGTDAFEKRHYKLWKEGIDLLEAFLVVA